MPVSVSTGIGPGAQSVLGVFDFPISLIGNGLQVLIRFSNGVTSSGGKISQADDPSGNARHAVQASASRKPTLVSQDGRGWASFGGGQSMVIDATLAAALSMTDFTMWGVYYLTTVASEQVLFSIGGGSNGLAHTISAAAERQARAKGSGNATNGAATTNKELWILKRSGTTMTLKINNVVATLDTPTMSVVAASGTTILGSITAAPLLAQEGLTGEEGAVDHAFSTAEDTALWTYASAFYSIS